MCAFAITNIRVTAEVFVADIEKALDADVGPLDVPHGLQAAPARVSLTPLLAQAHLSEFIVTGIDAVNIELTATNAVGSGVAADQLRVSAELEWNPTGEVREPTRSAPAVGTLG